MKEKFLVERMKKSPLKTIATQKQSSFKTIVELKIRRMKFH